MHREADSSPAAVVQGQEETAKEPGAVKGDIEGTRGTPGVFLPAPTGKGGFLS